MLSLSKHLTATPCHAELVEASHTVRLFLTEAIYRDLATPVEMTKRGVGMTKRNGRDDRKGCREDKKDGSYPEKSAMPRKAASREKTGLIG